MRSASRLAVFDGAVGLRTRGIDGVIGLRARVLRGALGQRTRFGKQALRFGLRFRNGAFGLFFGLNHDARTVTRDATRFLDVVGQRLAKVGSVGVELGFVDQDFAENMLFAVFDELFQLVNQA